YRQHRKGDWGSVRGAPPPNNKEFQMARVAILDDYQNVARRMADWTTLPAGTEVVVFADHLSDTDAVAKRLVDFDAVVAMRERTPFSRALLERLPRLKLLVTTGMRNASIDVAAAGDRKLG